MRPGPTKELPAALGAALAWVPPAAAQAPRAGAGPDAAQAERNAVDLRQGMTLEDVQKLLGKPSRTTLKSTGSSATDASLQWTYVWSLDLSLNVVFAAKTPEQWQVNGWDWSY